MIRDLPQVFSFIIGLVTLVIIIRKARKTNQHALWYPLMFITLLTLIYYLAVFIDVNVTDIINSSNVSAFVRLAVQITILLYAYYMPPIRRR